MEQTSLWSRFQNSHQLRIYFIMFGVGFFVSFILFYIFRFSFLNEAGSWEQYVDKAVGQVKVTGFEVFMGALMEQAKGYIILWLFANTILRIPYIKMFCLYKGFCFGFMYCVLFVNHGWKSLTIFAVMLFPQALVYAFAYLATFYMIGERHKEKKNKAGIAVCIILLIIGALLEGYVNMPLV